MCAYKNFSFFGLMDSMDRNAATTRFSQKINVNKIIEISVIEIHPCLCTYP